jgi:Fur family transcriptional regulator, ferric uptake regulator
VEHPAIYERFAEYLRHRSLKLTDQRRRIFDRAFSTHEHFAAETLYGWMREEEGPRVSRATVYRTLNLLEEGGFIGSMDNGRGEIIYEHLVGHEHHDHLICVTCGKIEEFSSTEIESLQTAIAEERGFELLRHTLRLEGRCATCRAERAEESGQQRSC